MVFWNSKKSEKTYRTGKELQIETSRNFLKILVNPSEPTVECV